MSESDQSKHASDTLPDELLEAEAPSSSGDLAVAIRESVSAIWKILSGVDMSESRTAIGRVAGLLAIGCMLISGYNFWWKTGQLFTVLYDGLNWALGGAVILFVSILLTRPAFTAIDLMPRET